MRRGDSRAGSELRTLFAADDDRVLERHEPPCGSHRREAVRDRMPIAVGNQVFVVDRQQVRE